MQSKRLSKGKRNRLADLGWERPDAPKAKRPNSFPHSKLVGVDDLCESGSLPEIPIDEAV